MKLGDFTVGIVGLGLMGGSLARALAASGAVRGIVGVDRDEETCRAARAAGCVDSAGPELNRVAAADLIVLAAPVRAIVGLIPRVGALARPGTVITDLGSTKREIVRALGALPDDLEALGAHPMCGRETGGFPAADAALFTNSAFVLTPLARTSPETLALLEELVRAVGARPVVLDAERHDRIAAAISHLPFLVASALMSTAAERARSDERLFDLAAGGFRDTTRVAAKDGTVMLDILLTNRDNVAAAARECARRLTDLADLVERGDEETLNERLSEAATSRRGVGGAVQRPASP